MLKLAVRIIFLSAQNVLVGHFIVIQQLVFFNAVYKN